MWASKQGRNDIIDVCTMFYVGVDVGGTNTDAVVLHQDKVIAKCKKPTTADVTSGVQRALSTVLDELSQRHTPSTERPNIDHVNIGTTHFLNAVLQRKDLARVAVIRLCGPASRGVSPFSDLPDDLKDILNGGFYYVDGGYEFDKKEITKLRREEITDVVKQLKLSGIKHVVISGIFSPLYAEQENAVAEILQDEYRECSFTVSHHVAGMGLLERENSSILNESLKPLGVKSIAAFTNAVRAVGLSCPIFFTQNDGTILSAEKSSKFPILTFSSGPTNSMRGAAFLSDIRDAIVVDIGGTSTDVGVLVSGFPRQASARVQCGGVTTNFRMPNVLSVALGGGSLVRCMHNKTDQASIGPDSVGCNLVKDAMVYGGDCLTMTDVAVAGGLCNIGDPAKVSGVDQQCVSSALSVVHTILENCIDQVKMKTGNEPLVLVGGGSVIIDANTPIPGTSVVVKPRHFEVANAVGAALSQVSGTVDDIVNFAEITREDALKEAEKLCRQRCVDNGAQPGSVEIVEQSVTEMGYTMPPVSKIHMKAVGDLARDASDNTTEETAVVTNNELELPAVTTESATTETTFEGYKQPSAATPATQAVVADLQKPSIDPATGDWLVNEFDIECIAVGAGILGCGGGGNTYIGRVRGLACLRAGAAIRIIHPDNVPEYGVTICVGYMGAPSVGIEKLQGRGECSTAIENVQKFLVCEEQDVELSETCHGTTYVKQWRNTPSLQQIPKSKTVVAIMSVEIGGTNGMEPLIYAAELGLPVVDCDGMGRAFPELQMFVPAIYGNPVCPCALTDCHGDSVIVTKGEPKAVENHLREIVMTQTGCLGALATCPLTADQLRKHTVMFSLSRAWHLGYAVNLARKEKRCAVQAIVDVEHGRLIMSGKVTDVERKLEGGFNKGCVKLCGYGAHIGQTIIVSFQNENLIVEKVGNGTKEHLAVTPDLISLVDSETGECIQTEDIRYGLRLSLIVLPCSPLLSHDRALQFVGPQAFGYDDVEYKSSLVYHHCTSIPQSREHRVTSR